MQAHMEFFDALWERLARGAVEYGDRSFDRPLLELLDEWEQEALDLAGWGYVMWQKARRLRARAQQIDEQVRARGES